MTLNRITLEFTTRCNLHCLHCLREPAECAQDFPLPLLDRLLGQARSVYGIHRLTLTGGEPLLHPGLEEALEIMDRHEIILSLVTNGHLIPARLDLLTRGDRKKRITHVAVSVEGGTEEVHDRIRGRGSYRKAMEAVLTLKAAGIPFGIKYTVGAHNLDTLELALLQLAHLEPGFIEPALMMPTRENLRAGLMLTPDQYREAETVIGRLSRELKIPVGMCAGSYCEHTFFGCTALCHLELYVDARGRLGFCCVLPGFRGSGRDGDGVEVVADLHEMELWEAHKKLIAAIAAFQRWRLEQMGKGALAELDRFSCFTCLRYFHKVDWLSEFPDNPWAGSNSKGGCHEEQE